MSASKRERREAQRAERLEKKSAALAEQEKKARSYRRKVWIVVVVAVVLIVAALLINSDIFYMKTTSMTVGTTKYSPAEVTYFYRSTYNSIYQNIYSQFGSMTSMLIDNSKPLSEQLYPYDVEGKQTWADAVAETAKNDIIRVTAFADAATKAGRTLSEEDEAAVSQTLDGYRSLAASYGYSNVDKFLAAYFGKGMDLKTLEKLQRRVVLSSNYYNEVMNGFTYTGDELAAYYDEHADEMDYYNYYVYTFYPSMDQFSEVEEDLKSEKVHEAAQAVIDATTDPDSFIAAVKAFAGEDTDVSVSVSKKESISINYDEWITDPARQPGDTAVLDVSDNSYALYFVGRDKNDYNTVDFRHILVSAVADDNGEYTDEALAAAEEKAQELYAKWQENPTEDNFADMANEFSDDTGSNTVGGLYEKVAKNTMVPAINSFLFDEGHVAGDSAVVNVVSGNYAGTHIVYYVGENGLYSNLLAEDELRASDMEAKTAEIEAGYEVKEGSGMRFVEAL